MQRIILYACSILALLAAGNDSRSAWGPSGCAVAYSAPAIVAQTQMQWHAFQGQPNVVGLYSGNTLLGSYNYADGFYRRWLGTGWSAPATAPIPPPFGGLAGKTVGHVFGMDPGHANEFGAVSFNGAEITEAAAKEILGANLRDDSTGGSLTYIDADKTRREHFVKEAEMEKKKNPRLANTKLQAYDPNLAPSKLMLAPFRLDADTNFRKAGKVLYAQHSPKPGEAAAKTQASYSDVTQEVIVDALRVIDPDWKPNLPALPSLPTIPDGLGLLLAAGLVTFGLLAVAVSSRNNS